MQVHGINNLGFQSKLNNQVKNNSQKSVNFRADENQYENPINRKTERNLAILSSAGGGIVGAIVGWWGAKCLGANTATKAIVAGVIAAGTMALTLPSKLYNTKVNAFAREKEMDVFSRQKEAQSNIYEGINEEIKDEKVSLDDKINHYSTVKMADNGSGVLVKGA